MKVLRLRSYIVSEELFKFSLSTYLILTLLETIKKGFVSNFFNLNILLIVVIVSGVMMVTTSRKEFLGEIMEKPKKLTDWSMTYIFVLSVGSGILVYYKMADLGNISFFVSMLTIAIVGIFSYLILTDYKNAKSAKENVVIPSTQIASQQGESIPQMLIPTPHLVHVEHAKQKAVGQLEELQKLTASATMFFIGTKGEEMYLEKVFPQSKFVEEILEVLRMNHETDPEYNAIMNELQIKERDFMSTHELPGLKERKDATHRGRTEKLLTLHKDILVWRLHELHRHVQNKEI